MFGTRSGRCLIVHPGCLQGKRHANGTHTAESQARSAAVQLYHRHHPHGPSASYRTEATGGPVMQVHASASESPTTQAPVTAAPAMAAITDHCLGRQQPGTEPGGNANTMHVQVSQSECQATAVKPALQMKMLHDDRLHSSAPTCKDCGCLEACSISRPVCRMLLPMAVTACQSVLAELLRSLRLASAAAKLLASKCISQYLASRWLMKLMVFTSPCHSRPRSSINT